MVHQGSPSTHILVSASCMPGTVRGKSKGDQAEPSGTGIRQGVDIQNTKLCHRLCAKSPLKGRKNALMLIGKLNFRTKRIFRREHISPNPHPFLHRGVQSSSPISQSDKNITENVTQGPQPPSPAFPARNCRETAVSPPASSDVCAFIYDTVCISERRKQGMRASPCLIGLITSEDKQLPFSQGCISGVFAAHLLASLLSGASGVRTETSKEDEDPPSLAHGGPRASCLSGRQWGRPCGAWAFFQWNSRQPWTSTEQAVHSDGGRTPRYIVEHKSRCRPGPAVGSLLCTEEQGESTVQPRAHLCVATSRRVFINSGVPTVCWAPC